MPQLLTDMNAVLNKRGVVVEQVLLRSIELPVRAVNVISVTQ